MNLSSPEITKAQEFLIQFVKTLTELPEVSEESRPLVKYLFVPTVKPLDPPFPHKARVLVEVSKAKPQEQSSSATFGQKTVSVVTEAKVTPSTKTAVIPAQKGSVPSVSAPVFVEQVRLAMIILTAPYFKDPRSESFRLSLTRIKPFIHELIEAVAKGGMHSADESFPFRFEVPKTTQTELTKKPPLPFPPSQPQPRKKESDRPAPAHRYEKKEGERAHVKQEVRPEVRQDVKTREKINFSSVETPAKTAPQKPVPPASFTPTALPAPKQPPIERPPSTIAAAPFVSPIELRKKEKKKQKDSPPRDEEEDDETP